MAMMISWVMPVNPSHPYLDNDPAPSFAPTICAFHLGFSLGLVNLPGYSPDFNADEAIWGWTREQATGNLCLGSREAVQERVGSFLSGLASRKDEVKRRCRTVLQSRSEALLQDPCRDSQHPANSHPTLALV